MGIPFGFLTLTLIFKMKKTISILGSTGSVGLNVLKIFKKKKIFAINLLSANKNYSKKFANIIEYNPKFFLINNLTVYEKVKKKFFKSKNVNIINNLNSRDKKLKSDVTISAIPGLAGLKPTIFMTGLSKKILIANKESIICGWNLIQRAAKKNKTKIIPIDSEHYSIFQLLRNHKLSEIEKIFITASGGPFFILNLKIKKVKPKDTLKHLNGKWVKKLQ